MVKRDTLVSGSRHCAQLNGTPNADTTEMVMTVIVPTAQEGKSDAMSRHDSLHVSVCLVILDDK